VAGLATFGDLRRSPGISRGSSKVANWRPLATFGDLWRPPDRVSCSLGWSNRTRRPRRDRLGLCGPPRVPTPNFPTNRHRIPKAHDCTLTPSPNVMEVDRVRDETHTPRP